MRTIFNLKIPNHRGENKIEIMEKIISKRKGAIFDTKKFFSLFYKAEMINYNDFGFILKSKNTNIRIKRCHDFLQKWRLFPLKNKKCVFLFQKAISGFLRPKTKI